MAKGFPQRRDQGNITLPHPNFFAVIKRLSHLCCFLFSSIHVKTYFKKRLDLKSLKQMAEFKNIKFKEKGKQNIFIQTNKKTVEF